MNIGLLIFVIAGALFKRYWLLAATFACLLVSFGLLASGLPERSRTAHAVFWMAVASVLLLVGFHFVRF